MKKVYLIWMIVGWASCTHARLPDATSGAGMYTGPVYAYLADTLPVKHIPDMAVVEKDFLYDKYTLQDKYPYKDTSRVFQWGVIRSKLEMADSLRQLDGKWGILRNYKNIYGAPPVVRDPRQNSYNRIADPYGVERYQGVPLYAAPGLSVPERYGRDGSLVRILDQGKDSVRISAVYIGGEWIVPSKYVKEIPADSMDFNKVIAVDRTNQNIATLEKSGKKWLVRSMNPVTTGLHNPPYQQETPLGVFVIQEHKPRMIYYKDGTSEIGGFSPFASRFSNGGYLHGVPVNLPGTSIVEYSQTLGTTPRSHMCVRNATSHAQFLYGWAVPERTVLFVIN